MTLAAPDPAGAEFAIGYRDVFEATKIISGRVLRTPTLPAPKLSQLTGAHVFVKYENLQVTGSFKDRGSLVKLLSLTEDERKHGVIAMSAGNHAQAVAFHSRRLGIPATIVMPERTPLVKVSNTEGFGAKVVLAGATLAESQATARDLAEQHALTLVHPYDDPRVMAGQGTLGAEFLEDQPDLDDVILQIGGGGLISGCSVAMKKMKPDLQIYGVQAALYASMKAALDGTTAPCSGQTLAEGIAVKNAGHLTQPIVRALVSGIFLVDESQIEYAISLFLSLQKTMAEGAGAAALAALIANKERFRGRKVGLVLSGGNIDVRMLASIMVRGLEREDKIISLRLVVDDQPGMLGRVASVLGEAGANILKVSHSRMLVHVPAKGTTLDVMLEAKDAQHASEIVMRLEEKGFKVTRVNH